MICTLCCKDKATCYDVLGRICHLCDGCLIHYVDFPRLAAALEEAKGRKCINPDCETHNPKPYSLADEVKKVDAKIYDYRLANHLDEYMKPKGLRSWIAIESGKPRRPPMFTDNPKVMDSAAIEEYECGHTHCTCVTKTRCKCGSAVTSKTATMSAGICLAMAKEIGAVPGQEVGQLPAPGDYKLTTAEELASLTFQEAFATTEQKVQKVMDSTCKCGHTSHYHRDLSAAKRCMYGRCEYLGYDP